MLTGAGMDHSTELQKRGVPSWVNRIGLISWYFVGFSLAVAILILVLAATRDLVIPLAVSAFLAVAAVPLVDRLQRLGVGRSLAAAVTVVVIYGVLIGSGLVVGFALADQSDELRTALTDAAATLRDYSEDVAWLGSAIDNAEANAQEGAELARDGVASKAAAVLDSAVALIGGLLISVFLMYYLLKDGRQLVSAFAKGRDEETSAHNQRILNQAAHHFRAYFRGRTILAVVDGLFIGIGMAILGVPLAFAIGVVNLVGAYIPYFGAFVGGAFAFLIALSAGGLELALVSLVLILVVQNVLENALEPRIMGESLDMHPLTVLLVTTLGGIVAGIVGLILATPLYAVAKDYLGDLKASGFFEENDS